MKRLPLTFAERDATVVAPELLIKLFVVHGRAARNTEARPTPDDKPPRSGPTAQRTMFGPAGFGTST